MTVRTDPAVASELVRASPAQLFEPVTIGSLAVPNRIVMAPMTRAFAIGGVPHEEFASYYRRRAEGGVGLIVTQGTWIGHPLASNNPGVPNFFGAKALGGWKRIVDEVHAAGGRIIPQLWHVGLFTSARDRLTPGSAPNGPSGLSPDGARLAEPMGQPDIDEVIEAFASGAVAARELGFDGVELHGAHGYLLDQFFWSKTNRRRDRYGGDLVARTRFAVEIVEEVKRRAGREFPVSLRFSQWKGQDYEARLFESPAELERWLAPLVAAGVDVFHCSTRRYWAAEFEGSDLNLAGWTKKLTGMPTITVGAVGLDREFTRRGELAQPAWLGPLLDRLARGEFDLVALGRPLIANPAWPELVARGAFDELQAYDPDQLKTLT